MIVDPYHMAQERQQVHTQTYTKEIKPHKKMGDKTNQNKRNRRIQSKRRDQRTFHHSYPQEC